MAIITKILEFLKMFFFNNKKQEAKKEPSLHRWFHPLNNQNAPISSPFGERIHPITGKSHFHGGIDYPLPIGTPVYAVVDASGYDALYQEDLAGLYIRLNYTDDHNNQYLIYYMHLDKTRAEFTKSNLPKRGDIIGFSGNTGGSTGPHLHYEVRLLNKKTGKYTAIEPLQFIEIFRG